MYKILLNKSAQSDIADLYAYLAGYSLVSAERHISRLEVMIQQLRSPDITWNYFSVTGAPYRARLFMIGRRTAVWIVYRRFEDDLTVRIYRIWSASRNAPEFEI